jgi:carbonic anhydrase/acetyltransferase-like protein (isoleucine patch superfamily)
MNEGKIIEVNGSIPDFGKDCFLAHGSIITGDVTMGDRCSVWFNTVIRGDVHSIRIGDECNIQDNSVIHCTYQKAKTSIGNRVSIGHTAIIHGCTLEDECLIGMGAIVMDHAVVQKHVMIAAGSVVLQNTICESGWLYAGTPAKKIKKLDESLLQTILKTPDNYIKYASWH